VVEGQHVTSTRKLVDSPEEQILLEQLIDEVKPPSAGDCAGMHYLLSTPFRYPPLRYGSRFGDVSQRSLWYGAEQVETALGETAFYRLWFLQDSHAQLAPLESEHTAFRVRIKSARAIDLTRPPFAAHAAKISSRTSFAVAQQLGSEMRQAGVEVFRYFSARWQRGVCVGAFSCRPFAGPPGNEQHWHCFADGERVEFTRTLERSRHQFPRAAFMTAGELAPRPS
jgi:hypothetical protein